MAKPRPAAGRKLKTKRNLTQPKRPRKSSAARRRSKPAREPLAPVAHVPRASRSVRAALETRAVSAADLSAHSAPLEGAFRSLCRLRARFLAYGRVLEVQGTGFLISPTRVVTAAHCVFHHHHGHYARSVEVVPALSGDSRPFGALRVAYPGFGVPHPFAEDSHLNEFDVAFIDIESGLEGITPLVLVEAPRALGSVVLAGYPDGSDTVHTSKGDIVGNTEFRIFHLAPTREGQSGAPLLQEIGGELCCIGIHVADATLTPPRYRPANGAVRMSEEIANWLQTTKAPRD